MSPTVCRRLAPLVLAASLAASMQSLSAQQAAHYVALDGIDDALEVADSEELSFGNGVADAPLTIEAWIQPAGLAAKQNLLGKWGEGANQEYRLYLAAGTIRLDLRDSIRQATVSAYTATNQSALAGAWHHLAVTYDGRGGPTAADGIALYIDGLGIPLVRENSPAYVAMSHRAVALQVGREGPFFKQYAGGLDDLRLWGTARTQSQIQAQMSSALGTGAYPGLVAYWPFDEGAGTLAADATLHGHAASLLNTPAWMPGGPVGPPDPDVTAPEITNIDATNLTASGVRLTFDTDELTTGWVSLTSTVTCPCIDVYSPVAATHHVVDVTGLAPDTFYTYEVKAIDNAGNLQVSPTMSFRTLAAPEDTTPPTVAFSSPTPGTVSGAVSLQADASDDVLVVGVRFIVDGVSLGAEDLAPPYAATWDSTTVADGVHTLTAEARDAAGNSSTASMSITVANTASPGSAVYLELDGIDDYLEVNDADDLSFGDGVTDTPLTLEAWIRPNGLAAKQNVVSKWSDGAQQEYRLFIAAGTIRLDLRDSITQSTVSAYTATNQSALAGAWHHLAVTYDGRGGPTAADGIAFYVDGVGIPLTRENNPAYLAMSNRAIALQIGREGPFYKQYAGGLDEIRLWNLARTPGQIQAQMAGELSGPQPGLVAYWRFNEGAGTTAGDGAMGGHVASLFNAPTWAPGGPVGPADPDATPPEISNIVESSLTSTGITIAFSTNEVTTGWVSLSPTGACPCVDVSSPTAGVSHVVTVTGLVPDTAYIYNVHASDAAGNLRVGAAMSFRTLVAPVDSAPPAISLTAPGEGAVAGTVLIQAVATDDVGVVGVQFKLDGVPLGEEDATPPYAISWNTQAAADGPHTITADARDAAGHVASTSVAVTVANAPGTGGPHFLDFDGVNDYVEVADADSLSFGNGVTDSPFTLETWFRADLITTAKQNLIGKWSDPVNQEYRLYLAGGTLRMDLRDSSGQATVSAYTGSQAALGGTWHHLAVTYDGRGGPTAADGLAFFVDGVQVAVARENNPAYVAMENWDFPLQIAREGPNYKQYDGGLDEIRLWNIARTQAEIQADLASELTGSEPGLVAYWKFNEGTGTTVADDALGGHTATLHNGPTWTPGGPITPTIEEPPAITSVPAASFLLGSAETFVVMATGSPVPAIESTGVLPAGVTFTDNGDGTATLAGTPGPGSAGTYLLTITAANGVGVAATQAFTLTVAQAAAITSAASAGFQIGVAGSFVVTASGFPAPSITASGILPAGITLTDHGNGTATFAGSPGPESAGSYPMLVRAANGVGPDATQGFTLAVQACVLSPSSGALPAGTFGTPYAFSFTATGGTGHTFAITAGALPDGLSLSTAGELGGTPTGSGTASFTVTATNSSGCAASNAYTLPVAPDAQDEAFANGVGNTQYSVGAGVPSTPAVVVSGSVLSNDNGTGPLTAGPSSIATALGGHVAMSAAGTFLYTPPAGFAGPSDTFAYTLTDGSGLSDTAMVTIHLGGVVWYVDASAPAGDGRSHHPFNAMPAASAAAQAGHVIYVHQGAPVGATTLKPGQALWGAGATFTLSGLVIAPSSAPVLHGTVTLADNVLVTSLSVQGGAGPAVAANGLTGAVVLSAVSVQGGQSGIDLTDVAGAFSMSDGAITGVSPGAAVRIAGGTGNVLIGASITTTSGRSVDVRNHTAGVVTFSGAISDSGAGILLEGNAGSTIAFTGGMALSTGANPAFTATGGGTVTVTQDNVGIVNTIATTSATALTVMNTEIGAAGLTFRSVSAGSVAFSPGAGIILDSTGTAAHNGGLTITGAGTPQSGGIIRRKTGPDGSTTQGVGIYLNSTKDASFNWLEMYRFDNSAIAGRNVNGFSIANSMISDAGTTPGIVEGPLMFGLPGGVNGLQGAGVIRDTVISGGIADNVAFYNQSGAMTLLIERTTPTPGGCQIGFNSVATGTRGLLLQIEGTATATATVNRCRFRDNRGIGLLATAADDASLTVSVTGSATDSSQTSEFVRTASGQGDEGIVVANAGNAEVAVAVENAILTGYVGTGVRLGQSAGNASALSLLSATIVGNQIDIPAGPTNNGGIVGHFSSTPGDISRARLLISGNRVNQYGLAPAITLASGDAGTTPQVDLTLTGNHVDMRESAPGSGVRGPVGTLIQSAAGSVCASIRENISHLYPVDVDPQGGGIRASQTGSGTFGLERGSEPLGTDPGQVLSANNPAPSLSVMVTEALGGVAVVENGTCLVPLTPED